MRKRNVTGSVGGRLVVYAYALFLIAPIYFIIVTSLKMAGEVTTNPLGLPEYPIIGNFVEAFTRGNIAKYSFNSVIITGSAVILSLLNAIIVSFCLHKIAHKKIGVLFYAIIMGSMLIPGVGFVTLLQLYMKLHLYNNLLGPILMGATTGLPFNVFILVGFLRTLPKEISEAATIDGCNDRQHLFLVLLPLIKSALATLGIFAFVSNWNSLLGPLILLKNKELFTIPLGLLDFRGTYTVEYNYMFAAILITSVPLVVIYLRFQSYFVEALSGGVKG
ncbi:carbohydrate ABC transporter permease [Cohnella silvisoli]|uniref:Carbohydrate ABC transporter permease n=1 Tax=Cohnella silvisoli TaxID=2873699 RepID=A0ABV1L3K3_9BACL|nr:carbohydrate ABC transporter permease [Cohnella silvisoli]MCD9026190.1 carbohydrate ABC transporter permease [Cohnella silvisoli]